MAVTSTGLPGLIGPLSITLMMVVLGMLSRRLGRVTRAAPHYVGFFIAAGLEGVSVLVNLIEWLTGTTLGAPDETLQLILHLGFPAIGVTIGAIVAWRYWSWLLAERD